jgi:hypothetical protein
MRFPFRKRLERGLLVTTILFSSFMVARSTTLTSSERRLRT